jgi:hypothetical protein
MTKILTALTFAAALGLSLASASAESIGGTAAQHDQALPVISHGV